MHLGIVVVYVVPAPYEAMLDLHLRQIARHTSVPYSIFGCAVRSSPTARARLESEPPVRLCACSPTTARGTEEHSHYLDQLTSIAVASGVTHVVTLHVDSFPIADGWIERLLSELSDRCPVATGSHVDTGCMIFTREFYLRYRPTFLPTADDRRRADFARCVKHWDLLEDSGVGYVFRAYVEGLGVRFLPGTASGIPFHKVYQEGVFHFRAALRLGSGPDTESRPLLSLGRMIERLVILGRAALPPAILSLRRGPIGRTLGSLVAKPRIAAQRSAVQADAEAILANPDAYLTRLLSRSQPVRPTSSD